MEYFKNEPKGVVVSMDVTNSGNVYAIWFPYTKNYMKVVREGTLIAVKNYDGINGSNKFSILELTSALPKHYALGSSGSDTERAFPGFVIEAAKNARVDWEQEEPIEQTTKIRGDAISTGLQLTIEGTNSKLEIDSSLPMVGEDAHILVDEQIKAIINKGLIDTDVKTIKPCNLILNKDVPVYISTEDLLKTHFGVFGFTGSGKSNLLSTLMNALLSNNEPNKIVLFDLMTEYSGLLMDLVHSVDNAHILCLTEDSLPGSRLTEQVLKGDKSKIDEASEAIVRTLLLPKEVVPYRKKYVKLVKNILQNDKIKLFDTGSTNPTISDLRAEMDSCVTGNVGSNDIHIRKMLSVNLQGSGVDPVSDDMIINLKADVDQGILQNKLIDYTNPQNTSSQQALPGQQPKTNANRSITMNATAKGCLVRMQDLLENYINEKKKEPLPESSTLSLSRIYSILNNRDKPALIIVQSSRDDDLRDFSNSLVQYSFASRRISGQIYPHVLFVYDEADEFIPQKGSNDSYAASKAGCTLLARRGRKFGLGLCISTQRVAYLDTSILAQPHTFLLSKLPRAYDREVIGKAFGASEDMIKRTLSFNVGQWLLFSYDATGLTNVPLPVDFPNANKRIINHLNKN
ncbi:MAG: DUF87 domain-containing protein [archaeon]